jgi:VanZ family protein
MRDSAKSTRLVRWLLVAAWMLVIFGLASVPGSAIPSALAFSPLPYSLVEHVAEYAILAGLLVFATDWRPPTVALALTLLLMCSLYVASDELHRMFVPGRHADPIDWATDTVGAGVTIAAITVVRRRRS